MHLLIAAEGASSQTSLWLSFLQPISTAVGGVITVLAVKYFTKVIERKVDAVATETADQTRKIDAVVTETTDQTKKIEAVALTADETKSFVNGVHGVALRTIYEQALRLANLTGDPNDIDRAKIAKRKMVDHETQQTAIDAKEDHRRADLKKE